MNTNNSSSLWSLKRKSVVSFRTGLVCSLVVSLFWITWIAVVGPVPVFHAVWPWRFEVPRSCLDILGAFGWPAVSVFFLFGLARFCCVMQRQWFDNGILKMVAAAIELLGLICIVVIPSAGLMLGFQEGLAIGLPFGLAAFLVLRVFRFFLDCAVWLDKKIHKEIKCGHCRRWVVRNCRVLGNYLIGVDVNGGAG